MANTTTFTAITVATSVNVSCYYTNGTPTAYNTGASAGVNANVFTTVGTGTAGYAQKATYFPIYLTANTPAEVTLSSGMINAATPTTLTDPAGNQVTFSTMGAAMVSVGSAQGTVTMYPATTHGVSWIQMPGSLAITPGNTWGPQDTNVQMALATGSADIISLSASVTGTYGLILAGR